MKMTVKNSLPLGSIRTKTRRKHSVQTSPVIWHERTRGRKINRFLTHQETTRLILILIIITTGMTADMVLKMNTKMTWTKVVMPEAARTREVTCRMTLGTSVSKLLRIARNSPEKTTRMMKKIQQKILLITNTKTRTAVLKRVPKKKQPTYPRILRTRRMKMPKMRILQVPINRTTMALAPTTCQAPTTMQRKTEPTRMILIVTMMPALQQRLMLMKARMDLPRQPQKMTKTRMEDS
mmetsp:Transcript_29286/g.70571  ORF Transcript_29286/g.70571 Transcript_29286/m.70571 type:complete len:237 (+) Transcript_29286:301-1011(+)